MVTSVGSASDLTRSELNALYYDTSQHVSLLNDLPPESYLTPLVSEPSAAWKMLLSPVTYVCKIPLRQRSFCDTLHKFSTEPSVPEQHRTLVGQSLAVFVGSSDHASFQEHVLRSAPQCLRMIHHAQASRYNLCHIVFALYLPCSSDVLSDRLMVFDSNHRPYNRSAYGYDIVDKALFQTKGVPCLGMKTGLFNILIAPSLYGLRFNDAYRFSDVLERKKQTSNTCVMSSYKSAFLYVLAQLNARQPVPLPEDELLKLYHTVIHQHKWESVQRMVALPECPEDAEGVWLSHKISFLKAVQTKWRFKKASSRHPERISEKTLEELEVLIKSLEAKESTRPSPSLFRRVWDPYAKRYVPLHPRVPFC